MNRTKLNFKAAQTLVNKYATGKTFRNLQMWRTSHECERDGNLFVVVIPDDKIGCYSYDGSDL